MRHWPLLLIFIWGCASAPSQNPLMAAKKTWSTKDPSPLRTLFGTPTRLPQIPNQDLYGQPPQLPPASISYSADGKMDSLVVRIDGTKYSPDKVKNDLGGKDWHQTTWDASEAYSWHVVTTRVKEWSVEAQAYFVYETHDPRVFDVIFTADPANPKNNSFLH